MKKNRKEYLCIIDDEYQVVKSLVRVLKDYCTENQIEIKTYTSPNDCLQELPVIGDSTSVILSDLRMPEMKGSDFFLSVNEHYPDIQLILLTAYHDIPDIQKAISANIFALIIKPWEHEHLIAEITKAKRVYKLIQDNKKYLNMIESQLEMAGEFQKSLMSTNIDDIENARIEHTYLPYPKLRVGGDYYDIYKLDDHRFIINMGDVAGHGVKPAFVTGMLKVISLSLDRKSLINNYSPNKLLTLLNTQLCKLLKDSKDILVTFCSILFDTEKMEMTIANAGHMPVSVVNGEQCRTYGESDPALGFNFDIEYKEQQVALKKGDIAVMYTDGLLESEIEHTKIRTQSLERFLIDAGKTVNFNDCVISESKLIRDIKDFHDDVALISVHV